MTWTGSWACAPQAMTNLKPFLDVTLRQVVRLSVGGDALRVRLDNTFGDRPLTFARVDLGCASSHAAIQPGSDRPVTFGGSARVTVPQGARALSDPVALAVPGGADVAVSAYLPDSSGAVTGHHDTCQESFIAPGDHAGDAGGAAFRGTITDWYFLSGVDVRTADERGAVVALGDSITNGTLSSVNRNRRWTDVLARRLLGARRPRAVLNQGIDGDLLLTYRAECCPTAESGLARMERDVVAQTGVTHAIILLGVNDIADGAGADELIAGLRQAAVRLQAHGIRVIGGTIGPFGGADMDTPARRAVRREVNRFIAGGGAFDGLVDFDAALRDPADPERLRPAYDSGDHLHPHDPGYEAMGEAVDLELLL